jgi:hypothetical protein
LTGEDPTPRDEVTPPAPEESLADSAAVLHEEGKSLSNKDKDLGEKLIEVFERKDRE